jgi:hypothetical protein
MAVQQTAAQQAENDRRIRAVIAAAIQEGVLSLAAGTNDHYHATLYPANNPYQPVNFYGTVENIVQYLHGSLADEGTLTLAVSSAIQARTHAAQQAAAAAAAQQQQGYGQGHYHQ